MNDIHGKNDKSDFFHKGEHFTIIQIEYLCVTISCQTGFKIMDLTM